MHSKDGTQNAKIKSQKCLSKVHVNIKEYKDGLFSAFIDGSGESGMEFYRGLQDGLVHVQRGIRTICDRLF
jgi:hypothetical protein